MGIKHEKKKEGGAQKEKNEKEDSYEKKVCRWMVVLKQKEGKGKRHKAPERQLMKI